MSQDLTADAPLVGREGELDVLAGVLRDVRSGSARVVEIAGDPGIGKTRLLIELARRAERDGMTVLSARAGNTDHTEPYAALAEAVDDHVAMLGPGLLDDLGADVVAALGAVVPALAHRGGEGPATPVLLGRAVRLLLERLSADVPVVLVLDDVHRIDDPSAALLSYLLRHLPLGPVLVAVTHRPKQTGAALADALAGGVRRGRVVSLLPGPLSPGAVDELLGRRFGRTHRAALHHASGGNPYYLEVLASARCAWLPDYDVVEDWPCPRIAASLHAELAEVRSEHQVVAHAAAVVGQRFAPDLVAAVADVDEAEVLAALDDLVARDLVRHVGASCRFAFRHPVVRHVAYQAAGAGWRLAAHARAAAALAAADAGVLVRAPHVQRSARAGDDGAVELLTEAALAIVPQVPDVAARWLRTALRLLPDVVANTDRRIHLLGALAEALTADGQLAAADAALEQVLALLPARGTAAWLCAVTSQVAVKRAQGRVAEAATLAGDELPHLVDPAAPAAAELAVEHAIATVLDGGPVLRDSLDVAIRVARAHDDRLLHAAGLAVSGLAHWVDGRSTAAASEARQATELLEAMPDALLVRKLDVAVWAGWAELYFGDPAAALRCAERAVALARTAGRRWMLPALLAVTGSAHTLRGDLDRAADCLEEAAELATASANPELLGVVMTAQSQMWAARGPLDAAVTAGARAVRYAERTGSRWGCLALIALAEARLLAGDPRGCVEALAVAGGGPELPHVLHPQRSRVCELVVRAELALDAAGNAGAWAERAALGTALGGPSAEGFAMLAQAQVLLDRDPTAAVQRATAAVSAFTACDRRLHAARARTVLAAAFAGLGKHARAVAELSDVEQVLAGSGAGVLLDEVARVRRTLVCGRAVPTHPDEEGLFSLTRRERQVAELVTQGHTNRQVAHRLGVSDKTVEAHLARVFAKLGVSSRAAVASVVARAKHLGAASEGA